VQQVGEWRPSSGLELRTASLIRHKGNNTLVNKTRIVTTILVISSACCDCGFRETQSNIVDVVAIHIFDAVNGSLTANFTLQIFRLVQF